MVSQNPNKRLITSKPKRKVEFLTIEKKLEIIKKLEAGVSRKRIMQEYAIASSTLYDIKHQKIELQEFAARTDNTSKVLSQRKTVRKAKLDQLDKVLFNWFEFRWDRGFPLSGPMIVSKAKELKKQMNIQEECSFSEGWLSGFKRRHGVRPFHIAGERKSADAEGAIAYSDTFNDLVEQYNLTADTIYNADETGLLWRCLPTTTLAGSSQTSANSFTKAEERLTILLCSNASGNHKLKLLVIGKDKKPLCADDINCLPVTYMNEESSWMDKKIFNSWFHHSFVPAVKDNLKKLKRPIGTKVLLLLDNCRAHPHENTLVSRCGNVLVKYLPANVTSLIQPMGQGAIQNFKLHYRSNFMMKLVNIEDNLSVWDFQRQFRVKDAIYMAVIAWNAVKPITLQQSWRKLWPAILFEDVDSPRKDFAGFGATAKSNPVEIIICTVKGASEVHPFHNLNEDQINDWLNADEHLEVAGLLTDEQVIANVVCDSPTTVIAKDSNAEENDIVPTPCNMTWAQAAESLEAVIKFLEYHQFPAHEIVQTYSVLNSLIYKKY